MGVCVPNETSVNDFMSAAAPAAAPSTPNPMAASGRVRIDIGFDHLPTQTALCWEAIRQGNQPPLLFRFAGALVRVITDEDGRPRPQLLTPEILRHHLSQWADWHKNEVEVKKPPLDNMKDVLASPAPDLPTLKRIVSAPVFAPDGSLRLEPGYHAPSAVLYAPQASFKALPVPDAITREEMEAARDFVLDELIVDFPFASESDKHNAVALFILPYVRDMIPGPTPNHLVEASVIGSGKSKLVDALLWGALGMPPALITEGTDDYSWKQGITTHLFSGKPVAKIDNVNHPVNSGALAAAITGDTWDERLLGTNTSAGLAIRTIWTMTGNNVSLSSELIRRTVRIRLVPATAHPEERSGFQHPNLEDWCRQERARLVQCAHIIVRWWLQAGRPKGPRQMASYYDYAEIIGGILQAAGLTEFLANYREFQAASDSQAQARSNFCATWYEFAEKEKSVTNDEDMIWKNPDSPTTSDLLPLAEKVDGFPLYGKSQSGSQTALGKRLSAASDSFVEHSEESLDKNERLIITTNTYQIVKGSIRRGCQTWRILLVDTNCKYGNDEKNTTH